jgi:DNA-binding response OmpR family regulator
MRTTIQIVSDDTALWVHLARVVRGGGYRVELAQTAVRPRPGTALALLGVGRYQANVETLADELRAATGRPVLVVASSGAAPDSDVLDASDGPAVLARIAEELAPPPRRPDPTQLFDRYRLDPGGQVLTGPDGDEVKLTRGEFRLLREFVRRAGRVVSRDDLLQAMSGRHAESFDRSVDMLVSRLRRKIEPDPAHPTFIVAIPGTGYKFTPQVRFDADPEAAAHDNAAAPLAPLPESQAGFPERRPIAVLYTEILGNSAGRLPDDPRGPPTALECVP